MGDGGGLWAEGGVGGHDLGGPDVRGGGAPAAGGRGRTPWVTLRALRPGAVLRGGSDGNKAGGDSSSGETHVDLVGGW